MTNFPAEIIKGAKLNEVITVRIDGKAPLGVAKK